MKFSIIIPAFNEEDIIGEVALKAVEAREHIMNEGGVDAVEIIIVNDGSTDKTHEAIEGVSGIKVLSYKDNAGYGAALVRGFALAEGDILGFMDGDGTCDARIFGPMLKELQLQRADMVIGLRLHPDSKMPFIRKVGNIIFAKLINFLGRGDIQDAASGMRVFYKEVLDLLLPLPHDLSFTPAMSAKAVLDASIKLAEVPISYEERAGRSKLHVVRDGFRFLRIILVTAITYRPFKMLGGAGIICIVLALMPPGRAPMVSLVLYWVGINTLFIGLLANEFLFTIQPIRRARRSWIYDLFVPLRSPLLLGIGGLVCLFIALIAENFRLLFIIPGTSALVFCILFYIVRMTDEAFRFRYRKNS